ncbi:MAG: PIG-L family deacetylase [Rhodobacteraceae bacterium]|nr:PIG-L family deacetylase [Paracoccaceae bacterium]
MTGPFLLPDLAPVPEVMRAADLAYGKGRVLLLIVAHADDPAIFAGGVLRLFVQAGWLVHALRVTDDRWDSVGLDEGETIARNAAEFRAAAAALGLAGAHDLGWQTDVLGDASRVALRERLIHAIRRLKPYALMGFDPNALFYEDNLDHKVLAEAMDEAFWTAMFDKHHPGHVDEGLAPHGCVERWYFGRTVPAVTHVFDTTDVIETQMQAVACHATPIANMAAQYALQAATARRPQEETDQALADPAEALCARLRAGAAAKGRPFGLAAAEYLRLHRTVFAEDLR